MTKEQLAEIRDRLAAASSAPWTKCYETGRGAVHSWYCEDIAALLAEIERLQEARECRSHDLDCDHFRWAKSVLND
jgi:hypothetical protein